jgi:hypothetical protein
MVALPRITTLLCRAVKQKLNQVDYNPTSVRKLPDRDRAASVHSPADVPKLTEGNAMLTLAMILTTAMAVPGDVPEKVSGEVEERLDLSGEWEGTLRNYDGVRSRFRWSKGEMVVRHAQMKDALVVRASFTDEGRCRVRLRMDDDIYLGIYRQEGDRITTCFSDKQYPERFCLSKTQFLIILHRVKPRE